MKTSSKLLSGLLCLLLSVSPAWPCSTFVLKGKGRVYFGRNLDWFWEDGLVVVNQRNIQKTAFLMNQGTPAKWCSKYGSVTFNQFGQELPFGGMNEAGLVVENMWLDKTEYPTSDARPAVNLLQWIQYQLDTCRTVEEVLAADAKLRVETPPAALQAMARIHYFVCDPTGDCATIEFLKGERVVHRGRTLPCRALANGTYEESIANMRANAGRGNNNDPSSDARFARAAARAESFKPDRAAREKQYAFDTLDNVKQGDFTVWQIVYNLIARKIDFRTRSNPHPRTLALKELDFSPGHPVQFVDIQFRPATRHWEFQDLTEQNHLKHLQAFARQDSVEEKFGDITPLLQGLIATLRTYTPAPK